MNVTIFIILFILIIYLLILIFFLKLKSRKIISDKNNEIKLLNSEIYELKEYNNFLNDFINKFNENMGNGIYNQKNNNIKIEDKFDIDDILTEISKNGIKQLDPNKLEFLKNFKKH